MFKKIFWLTLSAAALLVSACTTEKEKMDEHHFNNKLFINTSSISEEILVKPSGTGVQVSRELTIGTALKAANKITGRFVAAPELLETYKLSYYDENAVALADTMCVIENADITIETGATSSAPATVNFTELQKLDRETVYVMPVALRNVNGIDVLESKTVVYYVFKGASLINVVANIAKLSEGRFPPLWESRAISSSASEMPECLTTSSRLLAQGIRQIPTSSSRPGNGIISQWLSTMGMSRFTSMVPKNYQAMSASLLLASEPSIITKMMVAVSSG